MKNIISLCVTVALAFFLSSCSHDGKDDGATGQQSANEIYTGNAAMRIYGHDPDRALLIIDSGVIVGNIDEDLAAMLRAPVLEVFHYVVEHGFANSVKSRGMTDTYSEINDAGLGPGNDGENYTGQWDVNWE